METKTKFKLILLFAGLITCFSGSTVLAQRTAKFGVKAGMNVSNFYSGDVDNLTDDNARIGFNGGFYGQILSSETFAIQPELLYRLR